MADLGQIIEALVQRTERGNLSWVETVEPNRFVASVGAISVVVQDLSVPSILVGNTQGSRIQLEVLNRQGSTVEVVSSGSLPGGGVSPFESHDEARAKNLERLYTLARRSARGTQDTLDELARGLGIT
jgi:hypothetical protein